VTRTSFCAVFLLSMISSPGEAASIPSRSIRDRAGKADRVVLADVLSSTVELPGGDPRKMFTLTRLSIVEHYKGNGLDEIEVIQLGGKSGLWERRVSGDAAFEVGETIIAFLRCPDARRPERCGLVGLGEGRLKVEKGPNRTRHVSIPSRDRSGFVRRSLEEVKVELRRRPESPR
jgi:hypothetical protein